MGTRGRWLLLVSCLLLAGALVTAAMGGYVAWSAYRGVEPGVGTRLLERSVPVPSRLYGRAPLLEPGAAPARAGLAATLGAAGYRRVADAESVRTGEYASGDALWVIGRRRFRHPDGWDEAGRFEVELDPRGHVVALRGPEGRSLRRLRLDPPLIGFVHGDSAQVREVVPLAELPEHLVDAFIAIEDHRFPSHRGVDPRRVVGAAVANVLAGRIVQGGSTITQQLARNVYLSREKAFARKVQEAAIALVIEEELDKEQILDAYLDEIYLGQEGALAVHGVGAAARHYFGQDVRDLALHQAALLAALASGPSRYDPRRDPDAARARRDLVLRRMRELGTLEPAAFEAASALPLDLRPGVPTVRSTAFFADHVRRALAGDHDEATLEGGQLRIHTTLDWRLQHLAEQAVRDGLQDLEERAPKLMLRDPPVEAALLALDPASGDILAMVGGRDYGRSQFNRTTQARRQPGSVFKTVVALAALHPPDPPFTLASTVTDDPIVIPAPEPEPGEEPEEDWEPLNHDEEFRGQVTLRQALEDSLNVPMVKVGQQVGLRRVIETARALGIRGRLREVPSLALGTFEVSLLAMTRAYAALAAEGVRTLPRSWTAVATAEGDLLSRQRLRSQRMFGRQEVFLVTSALEGAVDRGTGKSLRALGFRGPVAGKTGSSDDYRDGWFIGYTPDLAVGVWVGFDDEGSLGLSGAYTALPIFARFLKAALGPSGGEGFEAPPGVERNTVMARVGPPEAGCQEVSDWFVAGTAPRSGCGFRLPGVGSGGRRWPWW